MRPSKELADSAVGVSRSYTWLVETTSQQPPVPSEPPKSWMDLGKIRLEPTPGPGVRLWPVSVGVFG